MQIYACVSICVCIYEHTCMYIPTCIHIYICMYTWACTRRLWRMPALVAGGSGALTRPRRGETRQKKAIAANKCRAATYKCIGTRWYVHTYIFTYAYTQTHRHRHRHIDIDTDTDADTGTGTGTHNAHTHTSCPIGDRPRRHRPAPTCRQCGVRGYIHINTCIYAYI